MKSWILTILFVVVSLSVSLGGYFWLENRVIQSASINTNDGRDLERPAEVVETPQRSKPVVLFALMLLGIVANQVYEQTKELNAKRNQTVTVGKLLDGINTNPRFWMAVSISPFIFYATYTYVAELPDDTVAMFYAFQNGFFWQAVFGGFGDKK